ncbi:MAG: Smr/MutS family protein [Candidatus Eisenbacteria bacterium]|uniref:Smr/MutS family protein n=1 Tax=Eiseniibacteriota bacterium TaxID=2212470 RepID=A0A956LWF4_UNCEI|nr:Smr/MutS family protein [Candidatus Eisenbacteria bacterium]
MTEERDGNASEEPVELPIEDFLDLHPFRPKEILEVVDSYLEAAVEHGWREVRLIHGKGTGFQRDRIQQRLRDHPLVESFRDAPASRGHWGATVVHLKAAE